MLAQAQFHFAGNCLSLRAEVLGATHYFERGGHRVQLQFPANENDFQVSAQEKDHSALGFGLQERDGTWVTRPLLMLRVLVDLELPNLEAERDPRSVNSIEFGNRVSAAADIARMLVHDYITFARVRCGQHWLAHSNELPRVISLTKIIDLRDGKRLPYSYNDTSTLRGGGDLRYAMTRSTHEEIMTLLEQNVKAGLPEILLADAGYLAGASEPPQYREAVLIGGVAAEVKIKHCLDAVCPSHSRALFELAVGSNARGASLYHKFSEAVTGRSFAVENKSAYDDLHRLFDLRNRVAHRAEEIIAKDVRAGLDAVRTAFLWADSLTAPSAKIEEG